MLSDSSHVDDQQAVTTTVCFGWHRSLYKKVNIITTTSPNEAKRSFADHYAKPTPHSYLLEMSRLGYQIAERARPYCVAAAELLADKNPGWPIRMLDVGCSYGIGSAFVKYGCTFEELVSFFSSRAPEDYVACIAAMRMWLNVVPPKIEMGVVGLDIAGSAVQFAVDSGLLDCGIVRNLETEDLSQDEIAWISGCNLLICTGAIGYIGERTFDRILPHLGTSRTDTSGPAAIMTVLRMFDINEAEAAFNRVGMEVRKVPGIRLPQRGFADEEEMQGVLSVLADKGIDPEGWESHGAYYADLYVAASPRLVDRLVDVMVNTDDGASLFSSHVAVAAAKSPDDLTLPVG